MSEQHPNPGERLVEAYDRMMERLNEALENAEHQASTAFYEGLERVKQTAVESEELSGDEAERVAGYVRRDVEGAARHLHQGEEDLSGWLRFDLQRIEARLLDGLMSVADPTNVELAELAERARHADEYRTGEVAGIGTLTCAGCGEVLHFTRTGRIPPCPRCHGTLFRRPAQE